MVSIRLSKSTSMTKPPTHTTSVKINPDATAVIIDDDSTTEFQVMSRNVPEHIGGAGVLLKYPSNDLVEVAAPLGATSASYTAEVTAATSAIQKVIPRQTHITHILWATDSRGLLDALSGNITKASGITQHLWRTITKWLDKGTRITAIRTPSHCGISENERATKLAKQSSQETNVRTSLKLNTF